jgi:type II secretory pathway pseudopilin PulG
MKHLMKERGFALVAVIFALVIMSTVAAAVLMLANDERRASRAVRAGNASFYAAEAGLNEVWATRFGAAFADSLQKGLINIPAGGSLDLGWKTLSNGATYNGRLWRYDNGGQPIYGLVAEGRGARGLSGQQRVAFGMTPSFGAGTPKLGKCCEAAATVRGKVTMNFGTATPVEELLVGTDAMPTGWPADRCGGSPLQHKAGIRIQNAAEFKKIPPANPADTLKMHVEGNPPFVQDPTMSDADFLNYGDLTFDELKAMATIVVDATGGQKTLSLTPKWSGSVCDKSVNNNWGSKDPLNPCYDYFPIVLIKGEVQISGGYGQALVIMDLIGGTGSEFELESSTAGTIFAGLIVGFGCPQIEGRHELWGAVYADGVTMSPTCEDADGALSIRHNGKVRWSSCVAQKVLEKTGVGAAAGGIPVTGMRKLSRGFGTVLR